MSKEHFALSPRNQQASCAGKAPFPSFAAAHEILRARRRGRTDIRGRFAYRCPFCRQWHLGSTKSGQARRHAYE